MMEMKVVLEFACASCSQSVSVTVKCQGKGLATAGRTVASVNVPCPGCGTMHRLDFEPNGIVRAVNPFNSPRPLLEPSVN
jgi:hypothetical protein